MSCTNLQIQRVPLGPRTPKCFCSFAPETASKFDEHVACQALRMGPVKAVGLCIAVLLLNFSHVRKRGVISDSCPCLERFSGSKNRSCSRESAHPRPPPPPPPFLGVRWVPFFPVRGIFGLGHRTLGGTMTMGTLTPNPKPQTLSPKPKSNWTLYMVQPRRAPPPSPTPPPRMGY